MRVRSARRDRALRSYPALPRRLRMVPAAVVRRTDTLTVAKAESSQSEESLRALSGCAACRRAPGHASPSRPMPPRRSDAGSGPAQGGELGSGKRSTGHNGPRSARRRGTTGRCASAPLAGTGRSARTLRCRGDYGWSLRQLDQAHRCAGGRCDPTRITQAEVAARNRSAPCPAAQRVGELQAARRPAVPCRHAACAGSGKQGKREASTKSKRPAAEPWAFAES